MSKVLIGENAVILLSVTKHSVGIALSKELDGTVNFATMGKSSHHNLVIISGLQNVPHCKDVDADVYPQYKTLYEFATPEEINEVFKYHEEVALEFGVGEETLELDHNYKFNSEVKPEPVIDTELKPKYVEQELPLVEETKTE